jgi:hypothetical protein
MKITYINIDDYRNHIKYCDGALNACYQSFLVNLYPVLDVMFYVTESYFWVWIWKTYLYDKQLAVIILTSLKDHMNNNVNRTARKILEKIE